MDRDKYRRNFSLTLKAIAFVNQRTLKELCVRERKYSDVEYLRRIYLDAELIDGIWYFEDGYGQLQRFGNQKRVNPQNAPLPERRYPASKSGHTISPKDFVEDQ